MALSTVPLLTLGHLEGVVTNTQMLSGWLRIGADGHLRDRLDTCTRGNHPMTTSAHS